MPTYRHESLGKNVGRRTQLKHAAKIILTLVLLAAILMALDTKKMVHAMSNINTGWLSVAIAGSVAFVWMRIVKWKLLTRENGLHAPTSVIARMMLMSLALGIVTPGRVGEIVAIAPFQPENRARAVMAYVYDRIGELCMVLLFCTPAALIFLGPMGLALGALIVAGCLAGILLIEWRSLRVKMCALTRLDRLPRLNAVLSAEMTAPASYWGACMLTYILAYALVAALIVGAGSNIGLIGISTLPVVTLSNVISITVGGLGVREGLAAAMAVFTEMTPEVAAAAFFLSFIFTRVVAGLVGLAWVIVRSGRFHVPASDRSARERSASSPT